MKIAQRFQTIALAAMVLTASLGSTGSAHAQQRMKWKMQSVWSTAVPHLGAPAERFVDNIARLSASRFQIKLFEPGTLVSARDCFDAVSSGAVEACWTTPNHHVSRLGNGVLFFSGVPFGPDIGEFFAWKRHGGGDALRASKYAERGVMVFDVLAAGPESSGWFKTQVDGVDDLSGTDMRFPGLGARVLEKLGVTIHGVRASDVYPALDEGELDAAALSGPSTDIKYGIYQIAKFNYYPGWHQRAAVSELLVNQEAFESLPAPYRAMLEVAAGESILHAYAETEADSAAALNEMVKKHEVQAIRWSDADLAAFENAWREVVAEEAARDPFFKRVAESFFSFRETYRPWGSAGALAPSYVE